MFKGFTPEAVDFLWGIRMNNNREWFQAHKQQYVQQLYAPMKELGKELFTPFLEKPGNVLKVSRIYRDARLHHPDPYKESLWICIRKDVQWWAEHPCLFFEIRPEGISYGFILWQPKVTAMEAFRQKIAQRPDEFLKLVEQTRAATGVELTAEMYKRPKAAEDPRLAPYFAWRRNLACTVDIEPGPAMFDPDLGKQAGAFLEKLIPLYEYFSGVTQ